MFYVLFRFNVLLFDYLQKNKLSEPKNYLTVKQKTLNVFKTVNFYKNFSYT